jgi:putative endonuclease
MHNAGLSKFTSRGIPWELKHTIPYDTIYEAKKEELRIKRMKSRKYIENLISKK